MYSSAHGDKCWGEYNHANFRELGHLESIIKRGKGEQFNMYRKGYKIGVAHRRPLQGKDFKMYAWISHFMYTFYVHISFSFFKNASFNSGKFKNILYIRKTNSLVVVNTEIWAIEWLSLILKLIFAKIKWIEFLFKTDRRVIDKIAWAWKTLQLDN